MPVKYVIAGDVFTMTQPSIGFIGFGEAGSHIAAGLRSAGVSNHLCLRHQRHFPDAGPPDSAEGARKPDSAGLVPRRTCSLRRHPLLCSDGEFGPGRCASNSALPQASSHLYGYQLYFPRAETGDRHAHPRHWIGLRRSGRDGPVAPYGHRVPMLLGGSSASGLRIPWLRSECDSKSYQKK